MLFPFFSFLRMLTSSSKSKASGWSKLYSFLAASSCSSLFNTWMTKRYKEERKFTHCKPTEPFGFRYFRCLRWILPASLHYLFSWKKKSERWQISSHRGLSSTIYIFDQRDSFQIKKLITYYGLNTVCEIIVCLDCSTKAANELKCY